MPPKKFGRFSESTLEPDNSASECKRSIPSQKDDELSRYGLPYVPRDGLNHDSSYLSQN